MSFATFEGTVENGEIRLKGKVRLPEHARVLVVVPEIQIEEIVHIRTPRLFRPEAASDFQMDVVSEAPDDGPAGGSEASS